MWIVIDLVCVGVLIYNLVVILVDCYIVIVYFFRYYFLMIIRVVWIIIGIIWVYFIIWVGFFGINWIDF